MKIMIIFNEPVKLVRKSQPKINSQIGMIRLQLFSSRQHTFKDSRFVFIIYTIIQNIISSEMDVRSAPWAVQLYVTQTQENIHKYRYEKIWSHVDVMRLSLSLGA